MTSVAYSKRKKRIFDNALPLVCVFFTILMVFFGENMKEGFISGARLAVLKILPTLFPFFILADFWSWAFEPAEFSPLQATNNGLLRTSSGIASAFILGTVCGFPLGVKTAVKQYECKRISLKELQWLCPLVNNPSAAFVISGIGAGLYGDALVGLFLYFSVIFSALLIGILFRPKPEENKNSDVISRQNFSLADSIRSAGISSLVILSYIVFFSALIGLVRSFIKDAYLITLISCFLEISSACSMTAELYGGVEPLSLAMSAFALGFSGFSVHLQAFSFMPDMVSKKKYIITKLLIGSLSFLISYVFSFIVI